MRVNSIRSLAIAACLTVCLSAPVAFAQNAFKMNDQTVLIGSTVEVPVLVDTSEDRHGASLSISWDNNLLEIKSPVQDAVVPGAATTGALWFAGLTRQSEGELVWSIVQGFNSGNETFDENLVIPMGTDREIAKLVFTATAVGTATIQFEDDLSSWANDTPPVATKNRLTTAGAPTAPDISSTATITIEDVPPPGDVFRRGDVNGDGMVDVSDPIANLSKQFLGQGVPNYAGCLDAADTNDDGQVDVSDPITNLSHQFLGNPTALEAPFGDCGLDPERDPADPKFEDPDLGCEEYPNSNPASVPCN